MKRWQKRGILGALAVVLLGGVVLVSGAVPIKASSGHWAITEWILHFAMGRSVATHSIGIDVPDLSSERLLLTGAGHFEGACRPCHGAPGRKPPPVPQAMTPQAPFLNERVKGYDDAELFYIVLHGVKFTGMPAWPAQKREDEVWAMVAFLRQLPELSPSRYRELTTAPPAKGERAPHVVREHCARCHGEDGLGRGKDAFPRLAGQRRDYLRASLVAYVEGSRHSGIMQAAAANLEPEEIDVVAEWYATRSPETRASRPGSERGKELATKGIASRRIPSCTDCHDARGKSHPQYPILAGQSAEYLRRQLQLFNDERRGGTRFAALMQTVAAHRLHPDEIRDVAAHYASQAWPEEELTEGDP